MKIRKYINNKYFNNIDYHEIKVINKELCSSNRVIERIVSITVISNLINWKFNKKNKIIIENEVEYKVLYLTKNDSRIYLAKETSYFYNEILIHNFINGMNIEVLIRKGLIDIGSNIQDAVIIRGKETKIYLSAILMNWIYIRKIPRILFDIEIGEESHYLYLSDKYINEIKQLTFEANEKFYNIIFSFEGDEIFYIFYKNNKNLGIFKQNIVTKQICKLTDNMNIVRFIVFNKDKLVYEEESDLGNNLCMLNINTLKSIYLMKDIEGSICELGCNRNSIYFSMKNSMENKVLILNSNREVISTLVGEYRNIIFIEKTHSFLGIKDGYIYIINLKSKNNREVKLDNINIINYKLSLENNLIIKGECNGVYQLILLNIETLEQRLIFQTTNEIGIYFMELENEVVISCREEKKWTLKKVKFLDSVENLGEIEGNAINMIVRGE